MQEVADEEASISGLYEQENASQLPCILNGAMAGLSGGALGYVFGFGAETRPDIIIIPPYILLLAISILLSADAL